MGEARQMGMWGWERSHPMVLSESTLNDGTVSREIFLHSLTPPSNLHPGIMPVTIRNCAEAVH